MEKWECIKVKNGAADRGRAVTFEVVNSLRCARGAWEGDTL